MPISGVTCNYANANAFCASSFNGLTGWRLPTKDELVALYRSGAMNEQGWAMYDTWSSTPNSTGGHFYVYLQYYGLWDVSGDTASRLVTCVR